jgi:hypothetical protein
VTDFELRLVRTLAQTCAQRLDQVREDLESMEACDAVPDDARFLTPQVLHDVQSIDRLLRRHVARRPCGAESP